MRIIYTHHAQNKFQDLDELGVKITKKQIRATVNAPLHQDKHSDFPNIISSGELDRNHVLRIVHRQERDKIVIITFYPARKDRYL